MKKLVAILMVAILTISVSLAVSAEITVSTGNASSFFVKDDGTLWAVGGNENGQLGDGSTQSKSSIVKIMDGVSKVSAGGEHTLVLKTDGSLYAMGMGKLGQLGNGSLDISSTPVKIMDNVAQIDAGYSYSAAIKTDGTLWVWGYNVKGHFSKDHENVVSAPIQIDSDCKDVACGPFALLIVKNDNTLWNKFVDIKMMSGDVSNVAAGREHNAYTVTNSDLYLWGSNTLGQIGDGSRDEKTEPVHVASNVVSVSAGYSHTLFIKNDNSLWATGSNEYGQLGDGSLENKLQPVWIMGNVSSVASFAYHNIAVKTDGSVWGWGDNRTGQLTGYNKSIVATPARISVELLGGQPSDWARSEVSTARQNGLVTYELSGNYQKSITREEFADLIIKMLRKTSRAMQDESENPFTDTTNPNIALAYKLDIVRGTGDGKFSPYATVTRQEMATMFQRTFANVYPELTENAPSDFSLFGDDSDIADWAKEGVYFSNAIGIVRGDGVNFDPKGNCTAEQAILIIGRAYNYINK